MVHNRRVAIGLAIANVIHIAQGAEAGSTASLAVGLPVVQTFAVTPDTKGVPFDPYEFYGIRASIKANLATVVAQEAAVSLVLDLSDPDAQKMLCSSISIGVGLSTPLTGATLRDKSTLCAQLPTAQDVFGDDKSIFSHFEHVLPRSWKLLQKNRAASAWVAKCSSACTQNGHAADWCGTICNLQANNEDGENKGPDPIVVSACNTIKKNKFAGPLPTENARMQPRLRNTVNNNGGTCKAVIYLLQEYDWQTPLRQAESDCKVNTKPNSVHFDYNQCVVIDSAAPRTIRYFDGPSIPRTAEEIHAIAKYPELILELAGMLVDIPPIYGALLDIGEEELAQVLAQYSQLFWWSGVAHDFCYHNGLQGHGFNKLACDRAFLSDNLALCAASRQPKLLNFSCSAWAELFYWILRFDLKDIKLPGYGKLRLSFSQLYWEASNYGYPYKLIDVVAASAQKTV